ncbi:MAG: mechanosensitive ion channel family protein [Thermoplasmatota archaeon]
MANHTNGTTIPLPESAGPVESWFNDPANQLLVRLIATVVTFFVAWAVVRLTKRTLERSAKRIAKLRRLDEYKTKGLIGRTKPMQMTVTIAVATVAAITLMGVWGLTTAFTGLLAGAGFAGIVIGLAAADTIGDIIAGFLIFYNHPFDIGDWVEIDGVQGIVEDVALGATTILTFDHEKITIPNRIVEGQKIKNFSHARKLRFRILVGVEYGTPLGKAMQTLVELGKNHPEVLKNPEPNAVSIGFGASSVDLELRVWVEPVRSSVIRVKTDLIHQIHDKFRDEGIDIAFPHTHLKGHISVEQA